LLLHGLSAISVYLDVVAARLLVASSLTLASLVMLVLFIVGVRVFTQLAIPGWASVIVGIVVILIMQIAILASNVLLTLLHNRGQDLTKLNEVDTHYVTEIRTVYERNSSRNQN
jgi:hypothetical protein